MALVAYPQAAAGELHPRQVPARIALGHGAFEDHTRLLAEADWGIDPAQDLLQRALDHGAPLAPR